MAGMMLLDPNFLEFIRLLNAHDVRYLVVGGYAVAVHGHPRYTGDLDVWVWIDEGNAEALVAVLEEFGFGDSGLSRQDFLEPDRVVQLGYPPLRIDLFTSIDGVEFEDCVARRLEVDVSGTFMPLIGFEDLIANKKASGRLQDLADVEALTEPD